MENNDPQYIPQAPPSSKSSFFHKFVGIIFILYGSLALLYFLLHIPTSLLMIRQLIYNTTFMSFPAKINTARFFVSNILNIILNILIFILGIKLFRNAPRKKIWVTSIIGTMILALCIFSVFAYLNVREEKKVEHEIQQKAQSVDRKTVSNLSVILYLKDPTLCKNIKNLSDIRGCVGAFQNFKFTADYCSKMPNDADQYECISEIAEGQKDKTLCYSITDGTTQMLCLSRVAKYKKDVSICDEIKDAGVRNGCIIDVGIYLYDTSYCEKADSQSRKDYCYSSIAMYTRNLSLCEKVVDVNQHKYCIHNVEIQTK